MIPSDHQPSHQFAFSGFFAGCSRGYGADLARSSIASRCRYLRSWGVKGDAPGQLKRPYRNCDQILFGDVYIADAGNQFIEKFDSKGKALLSFQEGALKHPQSIALDSGGGIYVTDPVRNSFFVFFPEGDRYRELHLKTKSTSENELSIAIGDDGRVHILDQQAGESVQLLRPPISGRARMAGHSERLGHQVAPGPHRGRFRWKYLH